MNKTMKINSKSPMKRRDDIRLPEEAPPVRKLTNPPNSFFIWANKYSSVRAEDVGELGEEWIVSRRKVPEPKEKTQKKVEKKKPEKVKETPAEIRKAKENKAQAVIRAACNSWRRFNNSMHLQGYFKVCDRWLPTLDSREPGQPKSTLEELARRTDYGTFNSFKLQHMAKQMTEVSITMRGVADCFRSVLARLKRKVCERSLSHDSQTMEAMNNVQELLAANIEQCETIGNRMEYSRLMALNVAEHQPKIVEILSKLKPKTIPVKCVDTPPKIKTFRAQASDRAMRSSASSGTAEPKWWELEVLPRTTRRSLKDDEIIGLTEGVGNHDFQFLKPKPPARRGRPRKRSFEDTELQ